MDLSSQKIIDSLSQVEMTILEQDRTKKTLYLKQGISANAAENNASADTVDELMRVVGVEPSAAIENCIGPARKLKVSSNTKLAL